VTTDSQPAVAEGDFGALSGATGLVRGHPTIVIDDLNVAGMTRNRRLAGHVAGVGMCELRHQVEYKAGWSGVRVHIANRWYPSSKTCSGCGVVKTTFSPSAGRR
jgi:putative transposase